MFGVPLLRAGLQICCFVSSHPRGLSGFCCCLAWSSTAGHLGCSLTAPQSGLGLTTCSSLLWGPGLERSSGQRGDGLG